MVKRILAAICSMSDHVCVFNYENNTRCWCGAYKPSDY